MNHIQTPNDAGLFSTFWKPIIRPTRLNYTVNDLGINNFVIEHTIVYREDYSITNSKN